MFFTNVNNSFLHSIVKLLLQYVVIHIGIVLANSPDSFEKITFNSANPFSFYHIITDLNSQKPHESYGILRFPESLEKDGTIPLIMGVNGSKNWADHHLEYLSAYRKMGFATFEIQSFNSRNVSTTVGEQVSVTTAMIILDVYMALDKLSQDKRIDINNVAITGWSLGGGVALFSAWMPLIEAIGIEYRFKAHLAIYPPCLVDMDLIEFSDAPIHILIGEEDDWVSADACLELTKVLKDEAVNIDITVYPDAHHGFDRNGPLRIEKKGYSTINCSFKMRSDGAILMNIFDIPMVTPFRQKLALACCAGRGTTIGGNPIAREASFEFSGIFMNRHLKN